MAQIKNKLKDQLRTQVRQLKNNKSKKNSINSVKPSYLLKSSSKLSSRTVELYNSQPLLTFDDVLLLPQPSSFLPDDVNTATRFSRNIRLNVPISSAAMDTVTEHMLAIAIALHGGIGIIHRNLSIEEQAAEIRKVKEKKQGKDFDRNQFSNVVTDNKSRLLVGAAVGPSAEMMQRAQACESAGADVIVLDTAHGNSKFVVDAVIKLKKALSIDVVAGNVATFETAVILAKAGADAVKVGIGPGSICTTRIVTGIGVPQISAIMECADAVKSIDASVPVIADGGVRYGGDIAKAVAAGADCVMLGSLLAGTDESPGNVIEINGKKYKQYRGMGSIGAMKKGSKDRYQQEHVGDDNLVPEGIEGAIPYKGALARHLHQLIGGLKRGMCDSGCRTISEMKAKSRLAKVSPAAIAESHPHSVMMLKDSPNYRR